jgi:hypothetical protein
VDGTMTDDRIDHAGRESEWARTERTSFWIALAIALGPIPVCLLISWALGSPPWRDRPSTDHAEVKHSPSDPQWLGASKVHGDR